MTGINYLIARGPQYDIPGAFQQGVQQGQQQNMLALASRAAQAGDYAGLGNALLQLGDVSGALTALKTPEEQRRTRALEQRQAAIDELNRRNIESEMKAREAAMGARDLRAVGNKVVDFSDPNNPRVVYSTPTAADALAAQLDSGGAPPAAAPAIPAPAPVAPAGSAFGPRAQPPLVASMISGKGDLLTGPGGIAMGGAPVIPAQAPPPVPAAAPTLPRTGTLADLTPQQRATARTLLVTDPTGTTATKYVTDILTGASAAAATKGQQPKPQQGHRFTYDEQGNIIGQERLPGVAPSEQESRQQLANVFVNEAPDIKAVITRSFGGEGGDPTRLDARLRMYFGRGAEGEALRRAQTGVDAITRTLTGAGLNNTEIGNYAARYTPDPFNDTYQMMIDKLDGLTRDLSGINNIVDKGGGQQQTQTALRHYLDANAPKASPAAGPVVGGPRGAPAAPGAPAGGIPSTAVSFLRANPGTRAQFDAKYGPGAAARVLGGG